MYRILTLLGLLISFSGTAQETAPEEATRETVQDTVPEELTRDIKKNEISLDAMDIVAFGALDITFEYLLNNHSSFSIEMFNKLFNKNDGEEVDLSQTYSKNFALTGKFKYFFDEERTAWGFYAMAFTTFSHGKNAMDIQRIDPETDLSETIEVAREFSDVAAGFGGGYKYVTKHGYFADLGLGFGRNLFHRYSPDYIILSNVSIGFRF